MVIAELINNVSLYYFGCIQFLSSFITEMGAYYKQRSPLMHWHSQP